MKKYLLFGAVLLLASSASAGDTDLVFRALDVNHDGKITKEEAKRNAMVYQYFDQADKDHDGTLSKDEFDAAFGSQPGGPQTRPPSSTPH